MQTTPTPPLGRLTGGQAWAARAAQRRRRGQKTSTHSSSSVRTSKHPWASSWSSILSSGTDTLRGEDTRETAGTEPGREGGKLSPNQAGPRATAPPTRPKPQEAVWSEW